MSKHLFLSVVALLSCALASAAYAADGACDQLMQLKLASTRITKVESILPAPQWPIPDGAFTRLAGPVKIGVSVPFCRVVAVIEKEITIEVWLPAEWNSRFEGVGNAGLTGALNYPAMAGAVNEHFAVASTDVGHVTEGVFDSDWIAGHPQRVIDFGHRAHHLMAERAKQIVSSYYNKKAFYSYFSGCSSGGWQGLTEAQRYPSDYDGILAGAPAINYLGATARGMVLGQAAVKEPKGNLDAAASQLLVQAATAACDANDGLKDGLIGDPFNCKFDPAQLLCKAGQTQGCLTAEQVSRVNLQFGPHSTPGGLKLYPGPTWGTATFFALPPSAAGPTPARAAAPPAPVQDPLTAMTIAMTGKAPSWTPLTFDPDKDYASVLHTLGPDLNSLSANLKPFADHGGKLILYHGGADPGLSPYNTLDYLTSVTAALGQTQVNKFVRAYFVPGMFHCVGGTGPSVFDALTPLIAWVEHQQPPSEIIATQPGVGGAVVRTRPLCAYPQVARYKGSGSVDTASSFECRT
jgi:feruloyl esterase